MRLAGILITALAAILHQTGTGMGQEAGAPDIAKALPMAGAPSLAPPEEVEGAWIGDEAELVEAPQAQPAPRHAVPLAVGAMPPGGPYAPPMYDEYAEKAAYMYGGYPEEYAGTDFSGDPHAANGSAPGDGGDFSGECCGNCRGGKHCGGCGCCGRGPCGILWDQVHSHQRFYIRSEFISWKAKGNPLPPLVTTSTDPTIPQDEAGVLGNPFTEILYGNERVNTDYQNGGRITAGMWLVDGEFLGIEGQYYGFEQSEDNFYAEGEFSQGGDGPILARPFTSVEEVMGVVESTPDSSLLAFDDFDDNGTPVDLDGNISITSKVSTQSANLSLRKLMWIEFTQNWRVDCLAGYRFFRMDDGIRIHDNWTETGGQLGTASFTSYDYFQAKNEFHGGELGLVGSIFCGRFSLELMGKLAMGNVHQTMKIDGTSFASVGGSPYVETNNFRLLTQPTNDGVYKHDVFAVIPETTLNLRFDLCCHVRLLAGYNFVYLSEAQRSGKAIDLNVNPTQIGGVLVGPAVPTFKFSNDNGYWMHGMNAGVEVRW